MGYLEIEYEKKVKKYKIYNIIGKIGGIISFLGFIFALGIISTSDLEYELRTVLHSDVWYVKYLIISILIHVFGFIVYKIFACKKSELELWFCYYEYEVKRK